MTRPRCPKCHKYYVTRVPEQRRLARTIAAIKRSIRREPPFVSPYHRYQCDICEHRWAVPVNTMPIGAPVATASTATRTTLGTNFGISVLPVRESQRSYPLRGTTTGVLTAKRPTVRVAAQSASRPATLTAARRTNPPAAQHSEASGRWHLSGDDEPTAPRRTLTQGGASSAHYVRESHPLDAVSSSAAPRVTAKLASVRAPRWQGIWRSFLPAREHDADEG